jgi:hypothetical protein
VCTRAEQRGQCSDEAVRARAMYAERVDGGLREATQRRDGSSMSFTRVAGEVAADLKTGTRLPDELHHVRVRGVPARPLSHCVSHCVSLTVSPTVSPSPCLPLCLSRRVSHCVSLTVSPTVSLSPCLPLCLPRGVSHSPLWGQPLRQQGHACSPPSVTHPAVLCCRHGVGDCAVALPPQQRRPCEVRRLSSPRAGYATQSPTRRAFVGSSCSTPPARAPLHSPPFCSEARPHLPMHDAWCGTICSEAPHPCGACEPDELTTWQGARGHAGAGLRVQRALV